MKTLTGQKPGQQNVAQELIKIIINYVAELRDTYGIYYFNPFAPDTTPEPSAPEKEDVLQNG